MSDSKIKDQYMNKKRFNFLFPISYISVIVYLGLYWNVFSSIPDFALKFLFNERRTQNMPMGWIDIACLALGYASLKLRLASYRALGKYFTYEVRTFKDHKLVNDGPYKYLIHPSYTAILMCNLTFFYHHCLNLVPFSLFMSILIIALMGRIRNEEQALCEKFGDEWYKHISQRWRLIPYIW
ncbi:hypothetical protein O9G_004490 [Rozella allomycis CSF55]|uniref:Protein-S-isoprenylcysteine O-methyltransferase n=1 Tax=Rozella allomycis (strain CSF55) TaxID=988480 RepID=A0A075B1V5_ROZAC|nr:hypothetical protein O9G_004490 [Rozella allomycis CSF55]|eukprot:EPZ34778.1 hypothetical protein O9G_004490 [Rozella allomycis CSF55]